MEAYHMDRFGAVHGIVLRSSEDPRPGPKEILMRVRASSLNYRDLMVLKGGGRGPTKIGVVPLPDGAGEAAVIGEGVTRVKIGDLFEALLGRFSGVDRTTDISVPPRCGSRFFHPISGSWSRGAWVWEGINSTVACGVRPPVSVVAGRVGGL